jgi:steroid delta-isomerase-like uncharacterized protein
MSLIASLVPTTAETLAAYLVDHDPRHLAEDATFTDVTTGLSWTGRAAITGMLTWMYHDVFEAHVEDPRVVVDADGTTGVAEMTFVGIHRGEFGGIPATGREVRIPLVVVYDFLDGRIAGARVHFSVASFLAQARA